MRLNSIRTRMMLGLIAISILVVLLFGGLELYNANQGIRHDTEIYDLQDSRYLANYVHMYMDNITGEIDIVSTSPDTIVAMQGRDLAHIKTISENLKQYTPKSGIIFIADDNSRLLYCTKPIDADLLKSYEWYGNITKINKKGVSDLHYSNALDDYGIAIIDPVRDNGTVVGWIIVVIPSMILQDNIQQQIISLNENVLIVDCNGSLIAHDSNTRLAINTNCTSYAAVQNALHEEEGVIMDDHTWDGQRRVLAFHRVPDLGWGLIVSTPENAIYRALVGDAIMMLGMLVLFIFCLAIVGYIFSSYVTTPIIRLSNTIQKISDGNYRERTNIKRSDEIGDMAIKFNAMMDELEHSNKAREDAKEQAELYMDLLSHDINNMNQVALGYTELALDAVKQGKYDPSITEKIREVLVNSSALIENIMKIRRIKAGELKLESIDLNPLIKETIDPYASVQGREVRINYRTKCDCRVLANNLLKDVFANLISNAIKHSTGPLLIEVELSKIHEQDKDYCMVAISDNGPGIPDEKKKVLFGRFMRGAKGMGLGLFLVKSLVENFKGHAWVEDRVPGDYTKGSKFVVMLPVFV